MLKPIKTVIFGLIILAVSKLCFGHSVETELSKWSEEAMTSAFSYSFHNLENHFSSQAIYFAPQGWEQFLSILKQSKGLDLVIENKMNALAKIIEPVKLIRTHNTDNGKITTVNVAITNSYSKIAANQPVKEIGEDFILELIIAQLEGYAPKIISIKKVDIDYNAPIQSADSIPTVAKQIKATTKLDHAIITGDLNTIRTSLINQEKLSEDAMLYAINSGKPEILELIINSGAKINGPNYKSINFFKKHRKYLAASDYDPQSPPPQLLPPISQAVKFNQIEMLKILIKHGANINVQDHSKNTALHIAANSSNQVAVKILLESGARADLLNIYGKTPFDIAREKKDGKLANLLAFK